MSFVSFYFLIFIAVVIIVYYITPKKVRWIVLLAASYIFYALNDIRALFFIIATTCTVFYTGILLDKLHAEEKGVIAGIGADFGKEERKRHKYLYIKKRRKAAAFALLLNFGILAVLKYSTFFIESFNSLLPRLHGSAELPYVNLLLPLGISFYTFQSLGYIIDVYRGKYPADKHLGKFALFVSFFPQIVQGPISRHDQLAHQLARGNDFDYENFKYGIQLILWGFFKKIVIANRAAILTGSVMNDSDSYQGVEVGFALVLFTIQLYADFSGGMDIARGVSRCLGIDIVRNFERPYFAISIADFWRRWHITLGTWMRDYLMYPIALSKGFAKFNKWSRNHLGSYFGKQFPTAIAMVIVFFVVGVWHGAGWQFIMFGFYNGVLIAIGVLLTEPLQKIRVRYPDLNLKRPTLRILTSLGVFFLVVISRCFIHANGLRHALALIYSSFSVFNLGALSLDYFERTGLGYKGMLVLGIAILILFFISIAQERGVNIRESFARRNIVLRWIVYYFIILYTLLFGVYGGEIADFIYQQF